MQKPRAARREGFTSGTAGSSISSPTVVRLDGTLGHTRQGKGGSNELAMQDEVTPVDMSLLETSLLDGEVESLPFRYECHTK